MTIFFLIATLFKMEMRAKEKKIKNIKETVVAPQTRLYKQCHYILSWYAGHFSSMSSAM